jgi:hypothetical protein
MTDYYEKITPVIIIGAMKSGTSSLFTHLSNHPSICPAVIKEPEFFSKKLGAEKYKTDNYWSLFDIDPNLHQFTLDASTGYTKYPIESGVPKRIYEYGLKPKLIYIVRNPFDRIRSHYNFMIRKLEWKVNIDSPHLINVSNYYLQLEQYRPFFPLEDLLIVDFEELKTDHKGLLKKVYHFLGISDHVFPKENKKVNETKTINRKELVFRSSIRGRLSWVPSPIKKIGNDIINSVFKKKQKQLTSSQRKRIYSTLKDDMLKFRKEYDFDVSSWGF